MDDKFLSLAKRLTSLGGDISSKAFLNQSFESKFKANKTIVTNIDIEIEEKQRDLIKQSFPDHGVHGEELNDYQIDKDYIWYLDPVDGTSNFAFGIPTFCSMASLVYKNQPIVTAINSPMQNKLYWAKKDKGAFLNKEKIHINQNKSLQQANISIDRVSTARDKKKMYEFLLQSHQNIGKIKIVNSIGVTAGIVADGNLDAQVCFGQSLHDLVAPYLLIKEAGGVAIDESGGEWSLNSKELFIAGNQELIKSISEMIIK